MENGKSVPVALGLGANLGDAAANIRDAAAHLEYAGLRSATLSPLYRTAPVGCPPGTPDFVNGAVRGTWSGAALELLRVCKSIEKRMGRDPEHDKNAPRTVDIDILLFGGETFTSRDLRIPHPQVRNRLFVLVPLAEIAGSWRVPPEGVTVRQLLARLQRNRNAMSVQPLQE